MGHKACVTDPKLVREVSLHLVSLLNRLRAGATITYVTVTVRTAAPISEIRGYPEFTIQIVLCAKRREIRGYPEFTIRDGTLREAPKYQG